MAAIQVTVERLHAGARQSVAAYDDVLAAHRSAAYALRRSLLGDPPEALRERLLRWTGALLEEAADEAFVGGAAPPAAWRLDQLLQQARDVTAGGTNRRALDGGGEAREPHALLPGVDAAQLLAALEGRAPMPLPTPLPPVEAHPAALAAALAGVPWGGDVAQWRASMGRLGLRVAERASRPPLPRGRHGPRASLLRAYLCEHAEALLADRMARLAARGVADADLADAERAWALKALDDAWQRHISVMAALRGSVNLRAFGLLEARFAVWAGGWSACSMQQRLTDRSRPSR